MNIKTRFSQLFYCNLNPSAFTLAHTTKLGSICKCRADESLLLWRSVMRMYWPQSWRSRRASSLPHIIYIMHTHYIRTYIHESVSHPLRRRVSVQKVHAAIISIPAVVICSEKLVHAGAKCDCVCDDAVFSSFTVSISP